MNREKTLVKNTIIYMIGNFASRFLGFLLLPLYTHYLSKTGMGTYDLIITTVTIIIPVITLQINDSLYRYLLDSSSDDNTEKIITNSVFVSLAGMVFLCAGFAVFMQFYKMMSPLLILIYILATVLSGLWQQIARGLKKNVVYSIAGVIFTFVTLASNILLIAVLKMGLDALFYSNVAASLALIVYVESKVKVIRYVKKKYINFAFIKELVKYSAPLLPNALNWWVISACSRYAILYYIGSDANGIFAAAIKFPGILLAFNSIFYLAWQESAIQEYESKDKNLFYSNMFNIYMKFQFGLLIGLIPVTRWMMHFMAQGDFYVAWKYVPMLYIGTVFQAFATFYGTGYLSSKDTKGAFTTSIAGAAINLVFNLVLTPFVGIQAASISNMLAFAGMWLLRIIQTRKYFNISIDKKSFSILMSVSALYCCLYYLDNAIVDVLMLAAAIPLFFVFNRELSVKAIGYAKSMLFRIRGKAGRTHA